jgi:hypothetical protein
MKPEGNFEIKFTKTYTPKIKINPKIPESITVDGVKCPKCGFPVTDKVSYMVAGGDSRSKNHCSICGHNF